MYCGETRSAKSNRSNSTTPSLTYRRNKPRHTVPLSSHFQTLLLRATFQSKTPRWWLQHQTRSSNRPTTRQAWHQLFSTATIHNQEWLHLWFNQECPNQKCPNQEWPRIWCNQVWFHRWRNQECHNPRTCMSNQLTDNPSWELHLSRRWRTWTSKTSMSEDWRRLQVS